MTEWIPNDPPGFVIETDAQGNFVSFIEEPLGNILTFDEIVAIAQAAAPPPDPLVQKTTRDDAVDRATDETIELTDVDDVLGASAYAEISNNTPGPQQTPISDTYVKVDQFDTVGLNKNITVSGPNSNLTIVNPGFYSIEYYLSFTGSAGEIYVMAIHENDTEVVKSMSVRTVSAANDVGSVSNKCILELTANDIIDLRVKTNVAGTNNFTLQTGNFIILKVR